MLKFNNTKPLNPQRMKTKLLLLTILSGFITFQSQAKTWVISNSGFTFSPATLTIASGDTVVFTLGGEHNAIEVSQSTWNSNGNSPLPNGFATGFSGGMVLPLLKPGTHYYVCGPHASMGMKGQITVTSGASVDEIPLITEVGVFPNPSKGTFTVNAGTAFNGESGTLEIMSLTGRIVYTASIETSKTIDLTEAAKGVYLIRLYNKSATMTRKLIIE